MKHHYFITGNVYSTFKSDYKWRELEVPRDIWNSKSGLKPDYLRRVLTGKLLDPHCQSISFYGIAFFVFKYTRQLPFMWSVQINPIWVSLFNNKIILDE